MAAIIEEVPVQAAPSEAPEAEAPVAPEAPEAPAPVAPNTPNTTTPMPRAKGRPKGAKDNTIRRRRPPPPPPSESSEEEQSIATIPDMRTRKQRMFDAWFD